MRKPRKIGFMKKVMLIGLFIAAALLILHQAFSIETVVVEGASRYTEKEIENFVMKDSMDHNSLYLYLKYKYSEQEKIPFVQRISIKMLGRHKVRIRVYEKAVIGCVEFMGEYMYFDKDGIIVENVSEKEADVPLITGLSFNSIALHKVLQVQKQELFEVILNLTQLIKKNNVLVDKISFDRDFNVNLICGKVTVLLGKHDFYDDALANLPNILKQVGKRKITLDMTKYKAGDTVIGTNSN